MQQNANDRLELLKFDSMEKTIGKWLRSVIRRLEREQERNRSNTRKQLNRRSENSFGHTEEIASVVLMKEETDIEKQQPSYFPMPRSKAKTPPEGIDQAP
jgi:hypothetical protein